MLSLRLIGPPVLVDAEQNTLRLGQRAMSVLAYIVLHAQPNVSRQTVAGSIWPTKSDQRAKGNLRRELHAIRSIDPVLSRAIVSGRTDIEFVPIDDLYIDTAQLDLIAECLNSGQHPVAKLQEAADTLCGVESVLLYGFDYEWAEVLRARFEESFLRITDQLIECLSEKNCISEALQVVDKQLIVNSFRESSYLNRMRFLVNSNNRALAIKTYEDCENHFLEELGVKPNSELRKFNAELLITGRMISSDPSQRSTMTGEDTLLPKGSMTIFGRQSESENILEFLAAGRDVQCSCIAVRGISGIGKSHTLNAITSLFKANDYSCLASQCSEYQANQPFAILGQFLQQINQATLRDVLSTASLNEVMSSTLPNERSQDQKLPPGQRSRRRYFNAIDQVIHTVGEKILITVDDVQWLDRDSMAWLTSFVRQLTPRHKVVFVFTERIVDGQDSVVTNLVEKSLWSNSVLDFVLEPLGATDAYRLYCEERQLNEANSEVLAEVSESLNETTLYNITGGRPQLIVELARYEGQMKSDSSKPNGIGSSITIQLANKRLEVLSSDALRVLEVVSIVNGPFHWKMLSSLCELKDEQVLLLLEELWHNYLLKVTESGDYELVHSFYRDVVLESMPPPRQTYYHNKLSCFYSREVENGRLHAAGLVAAHNLAAGDRVSAFSWFKAAAQHAEQSMAHEDSIDYCEMAIALLPELGAAGALVEEEISLLLLQVRQASVLEGYASPTVKGLCTQILNRSNSILDTNLSHDVNKQIRILYTFGNKPRKARATGIRQIADAESCGDLTKQIEAWRCKGAAEFQIGRFVDCEASMNNAIELADRAIIEEKIDKDQVPFYVTVACNFRALMQYIQNRPADGAASLALGQSYRGKHDDIFSRYLLSITLANVYQLLGDSAQVKILANQLQMLADEYHLQKMACIGDYFDGWVIAHEGDADTGLAKITAAIDNFPKTADHHLFPFWWSYKAELELKSHQYERAYHSIQKALAASRYTRQGVWVAEQYRLVGVIKHSLMHDKSECQEALSCSLRVADKQQAALFGRRTSAVDLSYPLDVT